MIVNADTSSSGERVGSSFPLPLIPSPQFPPLYEISSGENPTTAVETFGETSSPPDPARYRRVVPAGSYLFLPPQSSASVAFVDIRALPAKGLSEWVIEEGSGPWLIDENMNIMANVEIRDRLVIAAKITIFGALSVLPRLSL